MAKKKSKGPKKVMPKDGRTDYVRFRMKPGFKEWLERLAAHDRVDTLTNLFEKMAVFYARRSKFNEPPPDR
jgi:hypothetical protein